MREPKNQMLGTMVPPLMQLSVNLVSHSSKNTFNISYWTKVVTNSNLTLLLGGGEVKKHTFRVRSSNLSQACRHKNFLFSLIMFLLKCPSFGEQVTYFMQP